MIFQQKNKNKIFQRIIKLNKKFYNQKLILKLI